MRVRIEGCRKGGAKSGATRLALAKRALIEAAISRECENGRYDHNAASKIAKYFGVSARYVRKLATAIAEKRN